MDYKCKLSAKSLSDILEMDFKYDQSLIEILLPHRPPFLLVDSIISYKNEEKPSLLANYACNNEELLCSTNESDYHWPSMYIVEGLGQSCNLLIVLYYLEKHLRKADLRISSMDELLKKLVEIEPDETTGILKDILHERLVEIYSNIGFMGATNMEIIGHAKRGQVISYEVQLTQVFGTLFHSVVKAYTDNKLIAHGTMVSATRMDK